MSSKGEFSSLFTVQGLCKSFGGLEAVKNIDFHVSDGEIFGLIGSNGAGKTTCFDLITGFHSPTSGKVEFLGRDITGHKPYRIAQYGLVRSFQKTNVLKNLTCHENVLAGHYMSATQPLLRTLFPGPKVRRTEQDAQDSACTIVEMVGLSERMDTPANQLSCGESRLLEVAVALAAKPKLLILDEPAAGLNNQETKKLGELIKRLRNDYVQSIALVEHNMSLVMDVCDRLMVMDLGQKLAEGTPEEIRSNAEVIEAYLGAV